MANEVLLQATTVVVAEDPTDQIFSTEHFGPILAVHVFDDGDYDGVLDQMESFAPYALTGLVIAGDPGAVAAATERLRFAAGNFYINDKPTGAVVGQQPFGGARRDYHYRAWTEPPVAAERET